MVADTRKLTSLEEFEYSLSELPPESQASPQARHSLFAFAGKRREYLLNCPAIKSLP